MDLFHLKKNMMRGGSPEVGCVVGMGCGGGQGCVVYWRCLKGAVGTCKKIKNNFTMFMMVHVDCMYNR